VFAEDEQEEATGYIIQHEQQHHRRNTANEATTRALADTDLMAVFPSLAPNRTPSNANLKRAKMTISAR